MSVRDTVLTLPLDQVDLPAHVRRLLEGLGAACIQDAARFRRSDLIERRGVGMGSLDWLAAQLARGGLSFADEVAPAQALAAGRPELDPGYDSGPILDVIRRRLLRREFQLASMLFGWDGGDRVTLQTVGDRIGRTRERVRQVVAKARAKLVCIPYLTQRLDEAFFLIAARKPVQRPQVDEALHEAGIIQPPLTCRHVLDLAEWLGIRHQLRTEGSGNSAIVTNLEEKKLFRYLRGHVPMWARRYGALSLARLRSGPAFAGLRTLNDEEVVTWMESQLCVEWLDETQDWFWIPSDRERNSVGQLLRRLLAVTESVSVADLKLALRRHADRQRHVEHYRLSALPADPLREIVARLDFVELSGDEIRARTPQPPSLVTPRARIVVKILRQAGGFIDSTQFRREAREAGLGTPTISAYIRYSYLLWRPRARVIALVGFHPSDADMEELRRRSDHGIARVFLERGQLGDGNPWCAMRVSSALASSGQLNFPSELRATLVGSFEIVWRGAPPHTHPATIAPQSNVSRLPAAVLAALAIQAGDIVVFEWDRRVGQVLLVKGERALRRYRAGTASFWPTEQGRVYRSASNARHGALSAAPESG